MLEYFVNWSDQLENQAAQDKFGGLHTPRVNVGLILLLLVSPRGSSLKSNLFP